jgi:hypothetical protein
MRSHSFLVAVRAIAITMVTLSESPDGASLGHFFGMDLSRPKRGSNGGGFTTSPGQFGPASVEEERVVHDAARIRTRLLLRESIVFELCLWVKINLRTRELPFPQEKNKLDRGFTKDGAGTRQCLKTYGFFVLT